MAYRTLAAAVAAAITVTACTAPSQPMLDHIQAQCTAGDAVACNRVPYWISQVNREKQEQADRAATGLLLGLSAAAIGAAAGIAASQPHYYTPVVVVRPAWSLA